MGTDPSSQRLLLRMSATRVIIAVFVSMVLIELALVILDYRLNLGQPSGNPYVRLFFNMTVEEGLGSYVAIGQSFLIAMVAWELRSVLVRGERGSGYVLRSTIVALFLTWLALDDMLRIHENLGTFLEPYIEVPPPDGEQTAVARLFDRFPSYYWQLVLGPLYASMTLTVLAFLWWDSGPDSLRWLLIVTAVCFFGAVFIDFVEVLNPNHPMNPYTFVTERIDIEAHTMSRFGLSAYDTLVHLTKSFEEAIEMFGMTALWVVLLDYLSRIKQRIPTGEAVAAG